jgi:hypothetical protein
MSPFFTNTSNKPYMHITIVEAINTKTMKVITNAQNNMFV